MTLGQGLAAPMDLSAPGAQQDFFLAVRLPPGCTCNCVLKGRVALL